MKHVRGDLLKTIGILAATLILSGCLAIENLSTNPKVALPSNPSFLLKLDEDSMPPSATEGSVNYLVATLTAPRSTDTPFTISLFSPRGDILDDFQPMATGLVIPAGSVTKQFVVTSIDDSIYEGNEEIEIILETQDPDVIVGRSRWVLNFADNDLPPQLTVSNVSSVDESGSLTFVVQLSGITALPARVNYQLVDGTAESGSDFVADSGQVEFLPGETSKNIVVQLIDDNVREGDETFQLLLSTPLNATLGNNSATGTIIDDEPVTQLSWTTGAESFDEDAGSVSISVSISAISALPVTVDYVVTGTAGAADHDLTDGSLTIAPGSTSANLSLTIADDAFAETSETIILTLTNPVAATLIAPTVKTITILDNDDLIAPSPITSVTLSSDSTGQYHQSTSISPTLNIVAPGTDTGGSGVSAFEYQLIRNSDSHLVRDWTSFGTGHSITTQFSGLSLANTVTYHFSIRVKDAAGNASSPVASNNFTIQTVLTPYSGLALADPTTLSDLVISTSIDGATFTRTSPLQGKLVSVSGSIGWTNRSALFIRADELNFADGSVFAANGTDGSIAASVVSGGSGGSGGAGGTSCGTSGSAGGSGGNAVAANGPSGSGTGLLYSAGYSGYGDGGNGTAGSLRFNFPALTTSGGGGAGGAGGNGFGGGGGGSASGNCWGEYGMEGGGGGGGLVVIEANSISGSGKISARGGAGNGGASNNMSSGHGGGGVVWIAAKSYSANLKIDVTGGFRTGSLVEAASPGTARIFQLMSDGSLVQRSFEQSWTIDGIPTSNQLPFAPFLVHRLASLPNETLSTQSLDGAVYGSSNPYSAKTLSVTGAVSYVPTSHASIFLAAQNLVFSPGSQINASGQHGVVSVAGSGSGGSGGAGGSHCGGNALRGGSGVGGMTYGGIGPGAGSALRYSVNFDYGVGGAGGASKASEAPVATAAPGFNGAGGGGASNKAGNCWTNPNNDVAGGGGGLIAIYADSITGPGQVIARGGNGSMSSRGASGGGGGVIWIAAKSYDGQLTYDVAGGNGENSGSAGQVRIFKLNTDGSLTQKLFTDTW